MIYSQISGMKKNNSTQTIDISRQYKTYVVSAHWKHLTETERLQMTTTTISWRKKKRKKNGFSGGHHHIYDSRENHPQNYHQLLILIPLYFLSITKVFYISESYARSWSLFHLLVLDYCLLASWLGTEAPPEIIKCITIFSLISEHAFSLFIWFVV